MRTKTGGSRSLGGLVGSSINETEELFVGQGRGVVHAGELEGGRVEGSGILREEEEGGFHAGEVGKVAGFAGGEGGGGHVRRIVTPRWEEEVGCDGQEEGGGSGEREAKAGGGEPARWGGVLGGAGGEGGDAGGEAMGNGCRGGVAEKLPCPLILSGFRKTGVRRPVGGEPMGVGGKGPCVRVLVGIGGHGYGG